MVENMRQPFVFSVVIIKMKKKLANTKKSGKSSKMSKPKNEIASSGRRYELMGIAFLSIGCISLCGIWGFNVGFVGSYFAKCMEYLFGIGAIIVALFIAFIGFVYMSRHHGIVFTVRFMGFAALFSFVLAIYHHFVVLPGEEILPASLLRGGGLLGGGLLFLLRKFFGVDGALILLCGGSLGSILLATHWSLANGIQKTQKQAAKGVAVASEGLNVTYEKITDIGDRVEEQLMETVREKFQQVKDAREEHRLSKKSFHDVELDDNEKTATADETELEKNVSVGKKSTEEYDFFGENDLQEKKSFTIEYGNRKGGEEAEDFSPSNEREMEPVSLIGREDGVKGNMDMQEPAEVAEVSAAMEKPYEIPQVTHILSKYSKKKNAALEIEIEEKARILAKTLEDFRVKATIINACHGPAVTRYELEPAPGVKVSKFTNLADDLALNLAAFSVRIEPIPGKAAIGIEVPNKELEGVQLREVLENEEFSEAKSKLTVGLGMDIGGQAIFADLAKMPHLLVAGATGSGKSVCINTLITSVLFKAKPDEVKFILIDPKMVELSNYNGIPHLMVPVVTDAKKAASVLNWAVQEMEKRYAKFAEHVVRNMATYNEKFPDDKMFAIVIIIDELADLMMVAPHDVEEAICRLAQKARAAGIHLVLATQRPSVDVITGIIKANIPSRISFAVSSQIDSRTILDASGAEKLLGKGDMLFYPVGSSKPKRVQGAFISDQEVEFLLDFIRSQGQVAEANEEIISFTENAMKEDADKEKTSKDSPKMDALMEDAVEFIITTGQASASGIQRRFSVGYSRAGRIVDTMEQLGIVGAPMGSKPREILMTLEEAMNLLHEIQNS